jgi:hypothetical protein
MLGRTMATAEATAQEVVGMREDMTDVRHHLTRIDARLEAGDETMQALRSGQQEIRTALAARPSAPLPEAARPLVSDEQITRLERLLMRWGAIVLPIAFALWTGKVELALDALKNWPAK